MIFEFQISVYTYSYQRDFIKILLISHGISYKTHLSKLKHHHDFLRYFNSCRSQCSQFPLFLLVVYIVCTVGGYLEDCNGRSILSGAFASINFSPEQRRLNIILGKKRNPCKATSKSYKYLQW